MWIVLLLSVGLQGEKLAELPEIAKPDLMEIANGKLYLMEGSVVFQYQLSDLKLLRRFCKKGEGPGELKLNPGVPNYIVITPKEILAVSMDKAIAFSTDGQVLKEMKIPMFTNYLHPRTQGFIGMRFNLTQKPIVQVKTMDKEMKDQKVFYKQRLSGGQNLVDLTYDGVNIAVEGERIYVDQSKNGFEIGVYDMNGNLQKLIKKDVPKIKFSDKHKQAAMEVLKNNSGVKNMGWENFKKVVKFTHQEYLPAIQDMTVHKGRIYVMTNTKEAGKVRYLVFDTDGKELTRYDLPQPIESDFGAKVFGRPGRFYKFYQGYYYYLVEDEEAESWELHRSKLKQ